MWTTATLCFIPQKRLANEFRRMEQQKVLAKITISHGEEWDNSNRRRRRSKKNFIIRIVIYNE